MIRALPVRQWFANPNASWILAKKKLFQHGCGSKPMVPFWGRCTTHFRTYFGGWIGMFTGNTIWMLIHDHRNRFGPGAAACAARPTRSAAQAPGTWMLDVLNASETTSSQRSAKTETKPNQEKQKASHENGSESERLTERERERETRKKRQRQRQRQRQRDRNRRREETEAEAEAEAHADAVAETERQTNRESGGRVFLRIRSATHQTHSTRPCCPGRLVSAPGKPGRKLAMRSSRWVIFSRQMQDRILRQIPTGERPLFSLYQPRKQLEQRNFCPESVRGHVYTSCS